MSTNSSEEFELPDGSPDFNKVAEVARIHFEGFDNLVLFCQSIIMTEILVGNFVPGRFYSHQETCDFAFRYLKEDFQMAEDWGVEK